jgi:hypothetical protein
MLLEARDAVDGVHDEVVRARARRKPRDRAARHRDAFAHARLCGTPAKLECSERRRQQLGMRSRWRKPPTSMFDFLCAAVDVS